LGCGVEIVEDVVRSSDELINFGFAELKSEEKCKIKLITERYGFE
jgi:hypothetical protein